MARRGTAGGHSGAELTRRGLLALPAGGLAVGLAACGGGDEGNPAGDSELLGDALVLEQSAVTLYRAGAAGMDGILGENLTRLARLFGDQAAEHVDALTEAIAERGGTPPPPQSRSRRRRELKLDKVSDAGAFLRVAVTLENTAVAGYSQLVGELGAPELRRMAFELAENAAAHMSVLLGSAGEAQAPDPLVTGQPF